MNYCNEKIKGSVIKSYSKIRISVIANILRGYYQNLQRSRIDKNKRISNNIKKIVNKTDFRQFPHLFLKLTIMFICNPVFILLLRFFRKGLKLLLRYDKTGTIQKYMKKIPFIYPGIGYIHNRANHSILKYNSFFVLLFIKVLKLLLRYDKKGNIQKYVKKVMFFYPSIVKICNKTDFLILQKMRIELNSLDLTKFQKNIYKDEYILQYLEQSEEINKNNLSSIENTIFRYLILTMHVLHK